MSELKKMAAVREQSQAIGEFLDSQTKYVLGEWVDCTIEFHHHEDGFGDYGHCPLYEHLVPVEKSIEQILADYFEIDLAKVEEERMQILHELRNGGAR